MRFILKISRLLQLAFFLPSLAVAAPVLAQESPQIMGISHVAVKVSDIEKSIPFYRDFLGFAEQCRLNDPRDGSLKLVCLKVSDEQFIEVFTELKPAENRLYQIAFRVADAEAMRSYLAKSGVKTPGSVPRGQMKNLNFTVKDPNGCTIEFVQYPPDGWTMRDKGKFLPETRVSEYISHAGIIVADVPAAMHFYGDLLGLTESWRGSSRGDVISWINMQVPHSGDYVEYMLDAKSAPHFCLEVPDMEKAKAKLEDSPYRPKYDKLIESHVGKNGKRIINLFDPDGIRVELMEPNTVDGKPVPASDAPLPKSAETAMK